MLRARVPRVLITSRLTRAQTASQQKKRDLILPNRRINILTIAERSSS